MQLKRIHFTIITMILFSFITSACSERAEQDKRSELSSLDSEMIDLSPE